MVVTGYFIAKMLMGMLGPQHSMTGALMSFIQYAWPPFGLLHKFAGGEYGRFALTVGRFSVAKDVACVVHSLMRTVAYSAIGIVILSRREFSRVRD